MFPAGSKCWLGFHRPANAGKLSVVFETVAKNVTDRRPKSKFGNQKRKSRRECPIGFIAFARLASSKWVKSEYHGNTQAIQTPHLPERGNAIVKREFSMGKPQTQRQSGKPIAVCPYLLVAADSVVAQPQKQAR